MVSMTARVLTAEQKGNLMIARSILRIRPPAERGSERQAEPEVRVHGFGWLLPRWLQVRVGGHVGERPPAGRAATARVGLSRHGALLYSTCPLPATTYTHTGWRPTAFPVTSAQPWLAE